MHACIHVRYRSWPSGFKIYEDIYLGPQLLLSYIHTYIHRLSNLVDNDGSSGSVQGLQCELDDAICLARTVVVFRFL